MYFSNQGSKGTQGLGIVDGNTDEVEKVDLNEVTPNDILKLNNKKLLISHTSEPRMDGTKIGI